MLKTLNNIKNIFINHNAETLWKNNKLNVNNYKFDISSFGRLNKNKTFYVIKRTPGAGLFSNVIFVLNHLLIAEKHKFIPVIDMKNFPTIYSEKNKVYGSKNSWEYYFEPLSNYSLKEVYKSSKVIFTNNRFYRSMTHKINNQEFVKLKKKIKIKKKFILWSNKYYNKYLYKKKILGVHCRGTSYKTAANHPIPPTEKQILNKVNSLIKNEKYNAIFLCTEEKQYLELFKKNFGKILYYLDTYRSNKDDAFETYPRNFHRYKLGKEILLDTLILSKCDTFLHIDTNVSLFVKFFSKKKIPKFVIMKTGYNTSNEYIAKWTWHIKNILPSYLGGFTDKI